MLCAKGWGYMKYISILRGINVSGQRSLPVPADKKISGGIQAMKREEILAVYEAGPEAMIKLVDTLPIVLNENKLI